MLHVVLDFKLLEYYILWLPKNYTYFSNVFLSYQNQVCHFFIIFFYTIYNIVN